MNVHLIKEKTIRNYIKEHAGSKASFEEWLSKIKLADWNLPADIKSSFPAVDLLGDGNSRVVFDVSGNRFRMICKYAFGDSEVHLFVCWIGTHSEYDKLCKENKQYTLPFIKLLVMGALKYKVITSDKQYDKYCKTLEKLVFSSPKTKANKDEIALLTLLIEKYDEEHSTLKLAEPIPLLKSLMKDHKMKAVDLANLLNVSEGLVSDMLNYKKGLSKETIRILAERFKMNQEAFNRPYELHVPTNPKFTDAKIMNTRKKLAAAS